MRNDPALSTGAKQWPLDPESARLLAPIEASAAIDLAALPLEDAVAIARAGPVPPPGDDPDIASGDVALPVDGGSILLRRYRLRSAGAQLPLVLHIHGGGWVTGSVAREDRRCRLMCRMAQAIVISVNYRKSPEHRFPVAVDDVVAAWRWMLQNGSSIGGDTSRAAVSGSSAGGQLAAALILELRRLGLQLPQFQLLTYPALDPSLGLPSCRMFEHGPFMTKARMAWYWLQFLGSDGPADDPRAAPLTADLAGFPPAFVQIAEYDVLRDEGLAYAERLAQAGVAARTRVYAGMVHGFVAVMPDHPQSKIALKEGCAELKAALA